MADFAVGDLYSVNFSAGRIESQRAGGRRHPDHAAAVIVDRGGAAGRGHALRRDEHLDLVGPGVDPGEAALARVDVEPDGAVGIAGHAVGGSGAAVGGIHLDGRERPAGEVELAEGKHVVGHVAGEVDALAVGIDPGVVHAEAGIDVGRRAERPVGSVVGEHFVGHADIGVGRRFVVGEHHARRFAARARPQVELHRGRAGAAGAGEIGGEPLLLVLEDGSRLVVRPLIDAGHIDVLHQVDDGVPARLVELVLQYVARRVAAGAAVLHELLHFGVPGGRIGKGGEQHVAGQLTHEILDRREGEILPPGGAEVDVAAGGSEGDRLRPHLVFAARHRREIVIAGLVGEDRGDDVRAVGPGRHRDAAERLPAGRSDRPVEHRVGSLRRHGGQRRRRHRRGKDGSEAEYREIPGVPHGGSPKARVAVNGVISWIAAKVATATSVVVLSRRAGPAGTLFPRFEIISISSTSSRGARPLRASRRTATGEIVPASILRDAVLRTAPLDEAHGSDSIPCDLIGFMELIDWASLARERPAARLATERS